MTFSFQFLGGGSPPPPWTRALPTSYRQLSTRYTTGTEALYDIGVCTIFHKGGVPNYLLIEGFRRTSMFHR